MNGRAAGSLSLTPEGRAWEAVVPAAAWKPGLNEVRFRAAWRLFEEGSLGGRVSPGRFDDLFGRLPETPLGAEDRRTRRHGRPPGRGWSRVEEGESSSWAEGADATLLFTLTDPVDRRLRLRGVGARDRAPLAPVGVGRGERGGRGGLPLTPDGQSWETRVAAARWRPGLNEIRFRAAWRLSRKEAWAVDQLPFAGWRLEEIALEPVR